MSRFLVFNKKNFLIFLLFIWMLLMCFQNLYIIDFGDFGLKYYHVYSLVFLFFIKKIKYMPKLFFCFFYITFITLLSTFKFNFSSVYLNYIFAFYTIIVICSIKENITYDEWLTMLQYVATIVIIAVYIKLFFYRKEVVNFLARRYGHPAIETFFGGGVNIEATWISMFSLFFLYKREKKNTAFVYIYCILAFILDCIYSSRAGLLTLALCILCNSISRYSKFNIRHIAFLIPFLAVIFFIFNHTDYTTYIFKRFTQIGSENGSVGRIKIWLNIVDAFKYWPFGVGAGNSIALLELATNTSYSENNVHNYFFQVLLDFGFIGFIGYISILINFIKNNFKYILVNSFFSFLLVYIIISCIQFRGADAITAFILGIYCSIQNNCE